MSLSSKVLLAFALPTFLCACDIVDAGPLRRILHRSHRSDGHSCHQTARVNCCQSDGKRRSVDGSRNCVVGSVCRLQLSTQHDGFCTWYALKCKNLNGEGDPCLWYGGCPPGTKAATNACTNECSGCVAPGGRYQQCNENASPTKHCINTKLAKKGIPRKPSRKLETKPGTKVMQEALLKVEHDGGWIVFQVWEIEVTPKSAGEATTVSGFLGVEVSDDPKNATKIPRGHVTKVFGKVYNVKWNNENFTVLTNTSF